MLTKPADAYYKEVMKQLKIRYEDVIYVDDSAANVQAAKKLGFRSHHYQDHEGLVKFLVDTQSA